MNPSVGDGTRAVGSDKPLLDVSNLHVHFRLGARLVRAANGVSFQVRSGETLAILGESGSGKTVTMEAVLGVLESPPGHVTNGRAVFAGQDLLSMPASERRRLCGRRIAMVFQDPMSSLNPVYTVGWQIAEMFRIHLGATRTAARQEAIRLLKRVGIPDAAERVNNYPHQFSGGMRQRVVIAMALAARPEVIIADEPTTALDVTVEAQILQLLKELQSVEGIGLLLITHSMGVVAEIADRVMIMYAGRVVETGTVEDIFAHPKHFYTRGLLDSVVQIGRNNRQLTPIPGQPPDLARIPPGCAFHLRCPAASETCRSETPQLRTIRTGHLSACHHADQVV